MRPALLALVLASCSSSSGANGDGGNGGPTSYGCAQSLADWRASPVRGGDVDYGGTFAQASASCNASANETFESCDGPYDRMSWWEFDYGGTLFYDHASGALTAVFTAQNGGAPGCAAGPAQFFAPPATCSVVVKCGN